MRIGILETGRSVAELNVSFGTYFDFFQAYLATPDQDFAFCSYPVFEDILPRSPHSCDAYVITGSAYSVYDGFPWIEQLKDFIIKSSSDHKILGCCFGHQVIAEAFGGKVEKAPQGWGVGYHTYEIGNFRPWMAPNRKSLALIASHQDQVMVPPASSTVLAGSQFCPVGMLAIGENIMTTQLHPEFPRAFAAELYRMRCQKIGKRLVDDAIDGLARQGDEDIFKLWSLNFLCGQSEKQQGNDAN